MKLYVAYGSNMDEAQMGVRCPTQSSSGRDGFLDTGWLFGGASPDTTQPSRRESPRMEASLSCSG